MKILATFQICVSLQYLKFPVAMSLILNRLQGKEFAFSAWTFWRFSLHLEEKGWHPEGHLGQWQVSVPMAGG